MSSRKELKKTVNNLCLQVIYECFSFLEHTPSLNQENTQLIISEAVELRNNLIREINHQKNANNYPGGSRSFYRNIRQEVHEKTTSLIGRLDGLPR
jgi:hypothetical protein